ncbi:hypothetical protein SAY87_028553 [Trapa incisa]|uniref:WW domain-containing protein n=1 Tax=Trapa incisa TaxID=236973 RepID=A0AAN7KY13_9MYRT|nr:hypothetical protein SAY87_028553 [Trapa incisa]
MTAPNMATIIASLEKSLQSFSLNGSSGRAAIGGAGFGRSSSSDDVVAGARLGNQDASVELNSHISLPYDWEQRLDLETGEIYYVNWRTGKRSKEDPRITTADDYYSGSYYYSDDYEDDNSNCGSEESSSESSPASYSSSAAQEPPPPQVATGMDHVLVVGGCKCCLMYYMVPKEVTECPRCCGQLVHFERIAEDGSSL